MTEKIDIVTTIFQSKEPVTLTEIARFLNVQAQQIGQQVNRLKKDGLLDETEKDRYILSDKGEEWLAKEREKAQKLLSSRPSSIGTGSSVEKESGEDEPLDEEEDDGAGGPTVGAGQTSESNTPTRPLPSESDAKLTEYDFFYQLGVQLGIDPNFSGIVTRHVWNGGKYDDLEWVHKAFGEMQVRPDIVTRWWNAWRSFLNRKVAPELITKIRKEGSNPEGHIEDDSGQTGNGVQKNIEELRKSFTHIIIDDVPVFVGEGNGNMTYDDAKRLCEMRTAAKARGAAAVQANPPPPQNTLADQINLLKALAEIVGGNGNNKGKSYLVVPGEEGGSAEIREIEPGQPIVAPAPVAQQAPGKTFLIDNGEVTEIEPGRPYVKIIREKDQNSGDNPGGGGRRPILFLNPNTNMIEEWDPSKGPIMVNKPPTQESSQPLIQMTGLDGKPVNLSLSTYFALEEHKEKMQEKKESHEMKLGLTKEFKNLLSKGAKAFAHMSGEDTEEDENLSLPPPTIESGGAQE